MFNRIIKNNPNLKGAIIVVCYYFANSLRVKRKNNFILILCSPVIYFI
jgi:hypothetical protein